MREREFIINVPITITINGDRMTELEPLNKSLTLVDGELRANWTGYDWVELPYYTPSPEELNPTIIESTVTSSDSGEVAAID